jgi:hypothetical protein
MRHLLLAALSGALVLSACSDDSPQTPTGPQAAGQPTFDKGVPCPTTAFPLADANVLVKLLYPNGTPENTALAKVFDISKKWSQCKVADPRGKVIEFVKTLYRDWTAQPTSRLTPEATAQKVGELINLMYSGVGLTAGNDGYGLFTGPELLVKGDNNKVATLIPLDGFDEPTLIVITRLPDTPQLVTFGEDQFPPFYDITVTNASGTHNLVTGFGIVGFCVTDAVLAQIAANDGDPQIGHNPTDGSPSFEILEAADADEYADLGLSCTIQANAGPIITDLFHRGTIGDLALGAWNAASQSVASAAQAILLPQPLYGATVADLTVGVGGRTTKYSPFGVVDASSGD